MTLWPNTKEELKTGRGRSLDWETDKRTDETRRRLVKKNEGGSVGCLCGFQGKEEDWGVN